MRRAILSALLVPVVLGCSALHAQTLPESKHPEALYYANAYADHYRIPRELVHAIIAQESGWNQNARSNKGAIGLMQLMPATAARLSVRNPASIQDNIDGGVRYLAALRDLFHGDYRMVVAAYYCGEHHILEGGLQYRNPEVIAYVVSVEKRYEREMQLHHSSN